MKITYYIICEKCNKKIFSFNKKFFIGEIISAKRFISLDNKKINDGEPAICPFCKYKPGDAEFSQWIMKAQGDNNLISNFTIKKFKITKKND